MLKQTKHEKHEFEISSASKFLKEEMKFLLLGHN